ncbi:MAG: efflux RND transporter permease subunit [Proteobacteria bacterium]|nr:efflux RND transporter permease subunit [Pseudomonadota bacterium]MBU1715957.1 efflux RND transporter permease subunit [Pseudomonadota bacterium]
MIISDTAIKKRVSVIVLSLIIMIIGIYCYMDLPRESAPDITIPHVFISTSYKGVSPPDMETSVTIPIEKKLTGLENVKKIKSVSSEGISSIDIEFITGTDIDQVLPKVQDKVDEAGQDLPADLEEDPSVFEVNISEMPIVIFALSGTVDSARLKEIADDLGDLIETVPGVLEAEVTGGREREIRVEFMPEKLTYFGISSQEIEATLRRENQNVSGGIMHMADGRFQLQTPGELKSPQDFFRLIVGSRNGQPIYLADVANIFDGFKEENSRSRLDGISSITIMVKKRAGENIIRITDQVDAIIAKDQTKWPLGTKITKLMDQAKEIRNMVADLENNLISGLILVILVLPLALGIRNAILVGLAIPFSMFLSFTILYVMGITLNMVVLFSLTLALGMLVDNAIVIIENIYRFTSQGVPRIEAAMRATSEVAYPVIGSTLTTVAAFFPMLFWPGIMGEFMRYLPITLIVTLSASLFVAMVINPALASLILKEAKPSELSPASDQDPLSAGEQPVAPKGFILTNYKRVLESGLKNRTAVLLTCFALLILIFQAWLLRTGLERPVEFFPDVDPPSLDVNIDIPEGADIELCDRIVRQIEMAISDQSLTGPGSASYISTSGYNQALAAKEHQMRDGSPYQAVTDIENIKNVYANAIAGSQGSEAFGGKSPNHVGIQFLDFNERSVPTPQSVEHIRQRVKNIPGAMITIKSADTGPPTGPPINIEIAGDDFTTLGLIAKQIKKLAAPFPFIKDLKDDFQEGSPTIRLEIDRQKASLVGLSLTAIGQALKNGYNGLEVSTYREGNDEFDITIQLPMQNRLNTETLLNLLIATPQGTLIPLSTLASFQYTGSLGQIVRINNQRVVTVSANVDEATIPSPVARSRIAEVLAKTKLPPGYSIRLTGEQEDQKESEDFLAKAFIIALFLVSLVLITQFNSVGQPMVIMTSVILSLGGAFLGLTIYKMSFGIIMTGVGVISLAGVVVNNAIVLIDYTNKLQERGMACSEAIIAAGCTRLRPVLLTALTTILGLIPMVSGISYDFHAMQISWASESSQWWRSMAMAVIFGLLVATILTLVVVPILYSVLESIKNGSDALMTRTKKEYWLLYERIFGTGEI